MVERVRAGHGIREVAREFGVSLSVVQRWIKRASKQRLDRVDWSNRPNASGRPHNRTAVDVEALILTVRQHLADHSELGEYGAEAIRAQLVEDNVPNPPSVRTIGRVLERSGVLDGRYRVRRPPPPKGWYLPDVAAGRAELDSFDTVSGLVIAGGPEVVVLNGISLHGGPVTSWPRPAITAAMTASLLIDHWQQFGRPAYAQFDNDTIFQGPHHHVDVIGRVSRICLHLGIVPVFAPPREPGFQAAVESYNGRWQAKVWSRFRHNSMNDLCHRSDVYVAALRRRAALRLERAPLRIPMPPDLDIDLQARLSGVVIFLRRTDGAGFASMLGRQFLVDHHWPHRLTRAEVDLDHESIRFFALRRREPYLQPLLATRPYTLPNRRFRIHD
jgi:putative transposase